MKINPFTRVRLSLLVVAFSLLTAKTQSVSEHMVSPGLAIAYYRLVPGVSTFVEAEAILGPSTEVRSNTTERTVVWTSSDGTQIKGVFLTNGTLKSKEIEQKPKL